MKISTERLCIRNAETTDALGVYEWVYDRNHKIYLTLPLQ